MNKLFVENALSRGEKGKEWLENIPTIIREYEEKWSLSILPPFDLSYNYVAPATQNGKEVVIKIGFPTDEEFISEVRALEIFNGEKSVKILQQDVANPWVVLLEKMNPGAQLWTLNDNKKETQIAAELAKELWKTVPEDTRNLLSLSERFHGFEAYEKKYGINGPLPQEIFLEGKTLFFHLLETTEQQFLLHGDFHHMNILSSGNEWKIIDPKGVIGDPFYDLATFLYNPIPEFLIRENTLQHVEERLDIFSKFLEGDKERIIQWGIAQSVLSSLWALEDKGIWRQGIAFANLLKNL